MKKPFRIHIILQGPTNRMLRTAPITFNEERFAYARWVLEHACTMCDQQLQTFSRKRNELTAMHATLKQERTFFADRLTSQGKTPKTLKHVNTEFGKMRLVASPRAQARFEAEERAFIRRIDDLLHGIAEDIRELHALKASWEAKRLRSVRLFYAEILADHPFVPDNPRVQLTELPAEGYVSP